MLVVAVLLALGLLGSAAHSEWAARDLAEAVTRSQAEGLMRSLRWEAAEASAEGPGPAREALEAALADHAEEGLRFVALVDPEGEIIASAGDKTAEIPETPPPPFLVGALGARRVAAAPAQPMHPMGGLGPHGPRGPHGPHGPPGPHGLRPPLFFVEFEPQLERRMLADARVQAVVAVLSALALVLGAWVYRRLSARVEATEAELGRQRQLAALGEMSAVLAHEIKNPLAAVKGHAQLLAEQVPGDDKRRKGVDRVLEGVLRLESIVLQLLDFARSGVLRPEPTSPAALLREATDEVAPGRFAISTDGAPQSASLDAGLMRRALVNVLRNALQASPDDSLIDASVRRVASTLVFAVRDHGPGIPETERERVFEPFVTTRIQGAGLGLAVVRRVVALHGGEVRVEDAPGGGALVSIVIPGS